MLSISSRDRVTAMARPRRRRARRLPLRLAGLLVVRAPHDGRLPAAAAARRVCGATIHHHTPDHALRAGRPVAVIVPYRGADASASLAAFCAKLPAHLARHGLRFSLLAVAQVDALPFNRAALANAGFELLRRGALGARARLDRRADDYVAVQDVDRWPVDASEGGGGNRTCAAAVADYYAHPATARACCTRAATPAACSSCARRSTRRSTASRTASGGGATRTTRCSGGCAGAASRRGTAPSSTTAWCTATAASARAKPQSTSAALARDEEHCAGAGGAAAAARGDARRRPLDAQLLARGSAEAARGGCGGHTLHIVDVALRRAAEDDPDDAGAAAARASAASPTAARATTGAPRRWRPRRAAARPRARERVGARAAARRVRVVRVVAATRARVMYNYHYELDLLLAQKEGRRAVHRVAVCSQEWQPADVPPEARYHLMWRAPSRARTPSGRTRAAPSASPRTLSTAGTSRAARARRRWGAGAGVGVALASRIALYIAQRPRPRTTALRWQLLLELAVRPDSTRSVVARRRRHQAAHVGRKLALLRRHVARRTARAPSGGGRGPYAPPDAAATAALAAKLGDAAARPWRRRSRSSAPRQRRHPGGVRGVSHSV